MTNFSRVSLVTVLCLVALPLAIVESSCKKKLPQYFYKISGLQTSNKDNSAIDPISSDSVYGGAYIMHVHYLTSYVSGDTLQNDYGDTQYEPVNKPTSIAITCLQNYDAAHPANTSMNDVFIPGMGIGNTINNVLTDFPTGYDYALVKDFELWLMSPPTVAGNYSFKLTMTFDDGTTFSDTTTVYLHL
jgi:hypothetical protein